MAVTTHAHKNIAAVLPAPQAKLDIVTREYPEPGPNEIVVRNHAVAANAIDHKIQDFGFAIKKYPIVPGSDICGVVTVVGSLVSDFKKGDRVCGFAEVMHRNDINHGAWQTYTIIRDSAATKIPNSMSFEEGTVFPFSMAVSADAFFECFKIPCPASRANKYQPIEGVLIWGASTDIGYAAVQLAANLGFKVFAVAHSNHHHDLIQLGAYAVFSPQEPDVVNTIVSFAKDVPISIKYGFDTVTAGFSSMMCATILEKTAKKGSKLALTQLWPGTEAKPAGINVYQASACRLMTEQEGLAKWFFNDYLAKLLADGKVLPGPKIEIVEGEVEGAQKALDLTKTCKPCRKLVVKVPCQHKAGQNKVSATPSACILD